MLKEGDQLGRYTIRRLIGKGGWGEVYEAEDPELERRVAIKLIPREHQVVPEVRMRFEREAKTVAGLDHPNIVTLHSVEEDDGRRFITMQLVRGRTLSELIPEGGMSPEELFRIAIPMVDAVAAAHAKGITHRDIKPGNVMVTDDGQVKVLDFGLAKLMPLDDGETLASDSKTADGSLLGTLNYMSPEQLRAEEADPRSDIFALGIVLYEMATGQVPFQGKSTLEVAAAILRDRPSTVSEIRSGMPRQLDRILAMCLEEQPTRRFQSAVDLRNALRSLRDEMAADKTLGQVRLPPAPAPARRNLRRLVVPALALLVLALVAGGLLIARKPSAPTSLPPPAEVTGSARIVVLPFDDVGPPAVDYFAAGLTEEISSRLAAVDGLAVISRISANQYVGTTKTARQIGDELGVGYILAGSVRWAANGSGPGRATIAPTLIRVRDDTEIWGQPFERSLEDIFEIQTEIASRVAEQLGSRLGATKVTGLEERPTASLEAYQAYLRGLHYERRPDYSMETRSNAIAGFREAADIDPDFAAAWAWLARSHAFVYHLRLDRSQERREMARAALDRAVELAPELPETGLAKGYYYYWVAQDYERALAELSFIEERLPDHYEVHEARGYVLRRRGQWSEAQVSLERAFELNPRDAAMAAEIADSYANSREYGAALRWLDQSLALDPDQVFAYVSKAWVLLARDGDLAAARATLGRIRPTEDMLAAWAWYWIELFDGRPQAALEQLPEEGADWIESREWPQSVALLRGQALELAGDSEAARQAYQQAADLLRDELDRVDTDAHHHAALGLAYAGLEREEDAVRHGRRAVELQPIEKDAMSAPWYLADLALIYAKTGHNEEAIDLLEKLVTQPSLISGPSLRIDPRWQPLAGEPRFQALIGEGGGS